MSTSPPPPTQRINGPGELLQAVPYLLGFHPDDSLVLVGLHDGVLVVTARLDLRDADCAGAVEHTVSAMARGGASTFLGVIYAPDPARAADAAGCWSELAASLGAAVGSDGGELAEMLLVAGGRWRSLCCTSPGCCPPDGRALPGAPSAFAAAATYAGVVALPDRSALAAVLDPLPTAERARLGDPIEAAENVAVDAVLRGGAGRDERAVKRALFAAARASDDDGWIVPADGEAARFAVALTGVAVRDAVWTAVDNRRLDGRPLWRELARRLPAPYDAPPLFLFGWASWRSGDGALAGIAAERAIGSDPGYTAADLLLAALAHGVDPRRMPRMRLPRSA